jgi:hypothetical protein
MEPDIIYTLPFTSMDTELLGKVSSLYFYITVVFESISGEIVRLFLFVVLIVWGY